MAKDEHLVAHSLNRVGNWHLFVEQTRTALHYHQEALALFETVGMLARTLAFRPDREYAHDLLGSPQLSDKGRASCLVFRLTDGVVRNGEETNDRG